MAIMGKSYLWEWMNHGSTDFSFGVSKLRGPGEYFDPVSIKRNGEMKIKWIRNKYNLRQEKKLDRWPSERQALLSGVLSQRCLIEAGNAHKAEKSGHGQHELSPLPLTIILRIRNRSRESRHPSHRRSDIWEPQATAIKRRVKNWRPQATWNTTNLRANYSTPSRPMCLSADRQRYSKNHIQYPENSCPAKPLVLKIWRICSKSSGLDEFLLKPGGLGSSEDDRHIPRSAISQNWPEA